MYTPFTKLSLVLLVSTLAACGSSNNADDAPVVPASTTGGTTASNAGDDGNSGDSTTTGDSSANDANNTTGNGSADGSDANDSSDATTGGSAASSSGNSDAGNASASDGPNLTGDEIFVVNAADPFNKTLENAPATLNADGTPSVPQNLRVELIGNDWVEFNWTPSVDNGEVVAYNIYRDDEPTPVYVLEKNMTHPNGGVVAELRKFWETSSFIDCNRTRFLDRVYFCNGGPNGEPARGPEIGSSHTYQVSATDNDGNESGKSNQLSVQLYEKTGSPLKRYYDPYFAASDTFPFDSDLSTPASFVDRFNLVFAEDFNASQLDPSKWNTRLTWGPDTVINGEQQYFVDTLDGTDFGYDPFKFNGSTLTIEAIKTPAELLDAANGQRYLSGALSTYDKFGMTYGYVESRMRVSGVFGALSSFYLYHRWAADHAPEIDIVEYLGYNQYGDEDAFQTYHYADANYANNGVTRSSPTMNNKNDTGALYADDFHTYGVLWEPGLIVWYIDGVEIKRLVGPQVARQQMNIVTYLVTGSGWTQAPDEYQASDDEVEMGDSVVNLPFKLETDNPLQLEIDYIRVWQRPEFIQ